MMIQETERRRRFWTNATLREEQVTLQSNASGVNRSMPSATVIPVLAYDDAQEASAWLCTVFGFVERLRIGEHRARLIVGDGAVIVRRRDARADGDATDMASHVVMVRVEDVDRYYERALTHGACILQLPTDFPYGERQYSVEDPGGHIWTFSQTLTDVAPEDWGGTVIGDTRDVNEGATS
jgi:uncharacterized glyoxalase superfamily protein PhnB